MNDTYYNGGGFYEDEDLDFLLSEDCQNFMYEASAQVKQSFLSRIATKIKTMFQKIRNFFTSSAAKKQAEQLKNAVDENPELAKQKIQIEDYESQYKLGKRALAKIKKAKSKEEADQIVAQYQASRKRRKIVTITVGAALTAVIGGTLYARAKTKMAEIEEDLPYAKMEDLEARKAYSQTKADNFKKRKSLEDGKTAGARFGGPTTKEEYDKYVKKAEELNKQYDAEEIRAAGKLMEKSAIHDSLKKQHEAGILGLMAQDVRDQVMKPIQAIKRAMGKGSATGTATPTERPSAKYKQKEEAEKARQEELKRGETYGKMAAAYADDAKRADEELDELRKSMSEKSKKKKK